MRIDEVRRFLTVNGLIEIEKNIFIKGNKTAEFILNKDNVIREVFLLHYYKEYKDKNYEILEHKIYPQKNFLLRKFEEHFQLKLSKFEEFYDKNYFYIQKL